MASAFPGGVAGFLLVGGVLLLQGWDGEVRSASQTPVERAKEV
jgi:hypothetical protein